ncbi:hypothetical protein ACFOW1_01660 [Parasediminibacterium paludis]|uniref:Uncharacterized protein n=1 Tax=Parasediminibacterium paludis TaxID=908966 RepID=A0ABV8PQZ4_9BACT
MKKTMLILGLFFCLAATAQKKEVNKSLPLRPFASTSTDKCYWLDAKSDSFKLFLPCKNDTLFIVDLPTAKFIKVGGAVLNIKSLQEKGNYISFATLQKIIDGLQELPAKTANPVTQFVIEILKKDQVLP